MCTIPDETLKLIISWLHARGRSAETGASHRTRGRARWRYVSQKAAPNRMVVKAEDLADMLGPEPFNQEQARRELPPGVSTGLAWTKPAATFCTSKPRYCPTARASRSTGQLGEVMQESAKAAQSYIWSHPPMISDIDPRLFKNAGVHVHVPAGAIPKDGPSAGVTMATALDVALHQAACAQRRGDDRRDHADRAGIADRRREGEGPGRAPGRHPHP